MADPATKVRKKLEARRRELASRAETMERQLEGLRADSSGDTDFGEEGGEADTSSLERDRLRSQIAEASQTMTALDDAIAAVDAGTYGSCRICGAEIPEERLEALPGTALCVSCKAGGH